MSGPMFSIEDMVAACTEERRLAAERIDTLLAGCERAIYWLDVEKSRASNIPQPGCALQELRDAIERAGVMS